MEVNKWELHREDELFPECVKNEQGIDVDVLYGIGNPEALSDNSISVVGSRSATPYGIAICEIAGRVAAESDITVVSGGARGCDYYASRAALEAGGKSVIVSGCGADRIYPSSSEDVFRRVVAQDGCIVSMVPWGTPPMPYNFPRRNILIAALSPVLLVAEAGQRSGTMSTVEAALQMDRTIYAAPGSIFSPQSQCANRLISEGAQPICSEVDLEQRLSLDFGVARVIAEGVESQAGELISALVAQPMRPEELAMRLGIDTLTVLPTLADYESRGIVERLVDGRFSLTARAYQDYRTTRTFAASEQQAEEDE